MPRKAPPLSARAMAETLRPRTRKRRSGTSGSFARASTTTNAASRMTAEPNRPSTSAEPQPDASERITPPTSANRPAVPRTAPAMSKLESAWVRAALGDERGRREHGDGGDGHVDEEDPLPAERVDQDAAGDDAERAADAGQRAPDAERDVALTAGGERDGQQGEGRGGEQRGADALDGAGRDQRRLRSGEAARERRGGEQPEADQEQPPAAEDVAHPAPEQEQAAERERVAVDHPLQALGAEAEVGLDGRQRDIHDRDVEDDHELGDGEHRQRQPFRDLESFIP